MKDLENTTIDVSTTYGERNDESLVPLRRQEEEDEETQFSVDQVSGRSLSSLETFGSSIISSEVTPRVTHRRAQDNSSGYTGIAVLITFIMSPILTKRA